MLHTKQAHSDSRLSGPHCVEVTNRQQSYIRLVEFTDDLHIAESTRVAGMIELAPIFKLNHIPAGMTGIRAIFNTGRMDSMRHRDPDPFDVYRAALMYAYHLLNALRSNPACQLHNR